VITVADVETILGSPFKTTAGDCHAVSLAIVKAGVLGRSRVARGTCLGVGGQHSWVVRGDDCYRIGAEIVDPTLWSYDTNIAGVWTGRLAKSGRHRPHGFGSIWDYGKPTRSDGPIIELTPGEPLSAMARAFLRLIEPLDRTGWSTLAHAPVGGWPAAEIIAAMCDTEGLGPLIPIDIVGMLTDRNPGGLYR
jgi:hypothetical protein